MKTVFVLHNAAEVKSFLKTNFSLAEGEFVLATSDLAAIVLGDAKISYTLLDDYYTFAQMWHILPLAKKWSANWFELLDLRETFPELADYKGIYIPHLIQQVFYDLITSAYRSCCIAKLFIEDVKPEKIVLFYDTKKQEGGFWKGLGVNTHKQALRIMAEKQGVQAEFLAAPVVKKAREVAYLKSALKAKVRYLCDKVYLARRTFQLIFQMVAKERSSIQDHGDKKPTILFYAESRHADFLLPFMEEILRAPSLKLIAIKSDLSPRAAHFLEKAGAILVNVESTWDFAKEKKVRADAVRVRKKWQALCKDSFENKFNVSEIGASLWPLVRFQFDWLFQDGIQEIFWFVALAQSFFEKNCPSLMVSALDVSYRDLPWVLSAKKHGIPTLSFMHGVNNNVPHPYHRGNERADKKAVFGPLMQEWFVEARGRKKKDLPCVGFPSLTQWKSFETDKREFKGFDRKKYKILLLFSLSGGVGNLYTLPHVFIYEAFFSEIAKMEDIQLVIRGHPISDKRLPLYFAQKYGVDVLVCNKESLFSLAEAADIVISQPTTAMILTMLTQKPVVFYCVGIANEWLWWLQFADIATVKNADELCHVLNGLRSNEEMRRRAVQEQERLLDLTVGLRDGNVGKRVKDLFEDMILERNRV